MTRAKSCKLTVQMALMEDERQSQRNEGISIILIVVALSMKHAAWLRHIEMPKDV